MHDGGGTVWNTLKVGGTEKRGGETKILKRGGQAGSRGGCLKKGAEGGLEPPYELWRLLQQIKNVITSYYGFGFCNSDPVKC